ncbi:hypothetical protein Sjap_016303 [Stephania japonica]|uniref:Cytochrome P450 n=1 Tax=Stephania japonica TaxID=461633 RepID=A0AAP0NUV4_9MAGN
MRFMVSCFTVVVNAWAIQRDPSICGEEADKYIPERFMIRAADYEEQSFVFIPFSSGRRTCLGRDFAIVENEHALANISYWFDWKLPGDAEVETLDMHETSGVANTKRVANTKKIPLELVPSLHFPEFDP